jgi:hypothetical protein
MATLDTTFSGDGIEISDFPARYATSVAIQSDGKIVAVGTTYNDAASALFVIARYILMALLILPFQKMEDKYLILVTMNKLNL